jgi:hypothetical protein
MRFLRNSILQILLAGSLTATTQSGVWTTEIVDPGGGGQFASMRIDAFGNAHVAYMDRDTGLKYSFWDHSLNKWFTTPLDRTGGFIALALDSKQRPHISYIEYGTGKLKYSHWDGSIWQKQALAIPAKDISFYTSIALDANDYPIISFYEYEAATGDSLLRLRTVSWNGTLWDVRTADSTRGSGKFNSIAYDAKGNLHLAYGNVAYENATLRYARWNGRSWEPEIVEGVPGTGYLAFSVFIALDKLDIPHIVYTDVPRQAVKYASCVGNTWKVETVDSIRKSAYPDRNGLAFDELGNPYISYYDGGLGFLKIAHKKDGGWITEIVDRDFAGYTNSLQIHDGTIWVAYADEPAASLKVSRRLLKDAGSLSPSNDPTAGDQPKGQVSKKQ